MIILLKRRQVLCALLFCCFMGALSAVIWLGQRTAVPAFVAGSSGSATIVVDPGHGGEDGGAVAVDGSVESQINLEVALRVNDLLRLAGWRTVMTRTEDISIYSAGAQTLRQKKVSDLKNRVELVEQVGDGMLLSIHQNSLPASPQTHGAQVFWNQVEGADLLAASIQDTLNAGMNTGSEKKAKKISSNIYLMKNITAPGVLVECGFRSNHDETARLHQSSYQRKLAVAIIAGFQRAA